MTGSLVLTLTLLVAPLWGKLVHYDWDVRDWVVDYLRPTISTEQLCRSVASHPLNPCGGIFSETARELPFHIVEDNLKAAQLVNGLYPGPIIEADEGDTIEITVSNHLRAAGTTFHWHGLHMRGTPWEDGPFQVAQAPIMPSTNYTYRFEAYPAGTFYYHSHMDALQQSRGLKGPIVIHAKDDPFKNMYTEELVIFMSDEWRSPEVCFKLEGAMPGNPVCSDARYISWNGQWGDGTPKYPYPIFTVKPNTCYRLRMINAANSAENFIFSLAGHNMTLISVDGFDIKPIQIQSVNLHNGERSDVVVCFNQTPGYYLATAEYDYACTMLKGKTFPIPGFHPVDACRWYSFFQYEGTNAPIPAAYKPFAPDYEVPKGTGGGANPNPTSGFAFDTTNRDTYKIAEPYNAAPEPDEPDLRLVITLGMNGPTDVKPESTPLTSGRWFNDLAGRRWSWTDPATPVLHTKGKCGVDKVPIFNIPENVTNVEIILNNLSPTEHVMHLHGGNFRVINVGDIRSWCGVNKTACFVLPEEANPCPAEDRAFGDPDHPFMSVPDYRPQIGPVPIRLPWIKAPLYWGCKYNEAKDKQYQKLSGIYKDTVSVWQRSWTVIRAKMTNPGMWLFHCHLQPHIPLGMMMVFNVRESEQLPIPPTVPTYGPCPVWSWESVYQQRAFDNIRMAQRVAQMYGPQPPARDSTTTTTTTTTTTHVRMVEV